MKLGEVVLRYLEEHPEIPIEGRPVPVEEDSMTSRQLREECFDVVVYDGGKTGHLCPECGELLSLTLCTSGCPHHDTCDDVEMHEVFGQFYCPVLRTEDRND